MRIRDFGKVRDNLWHLGREESGIYVLQGLEHSMIINGGMSCILPDILRQMKIFNIDEGRIDKLLILHAHFDHVGTGPVLDAYEKALHDVIEGDHMFFWRQDGIELCWSYLTPILDYFETCEDRAEQLLPYASGSWDPDTAELIMKFHKS